MFTELNLIQTDRFLTAIPVVGTFIKIVDIFIKVIVNNCVSKDTIKRSLCLTCISVMDYLELVILAIPLVGTVIVIGAFLKHRKTCNECCPVTAAAWGNTNGMYLAGFTRLAAIYGHLDACKDLTMEAITPRPVNVADLKIAAKHDGKACFHLMEHYNRPTKIGKNTKEVANWFKKLEALTHSKVEEEQRIANFWLGKCYEIGLGCTQDQDRATKLMVGN